MEKNNNTLMEAEEQSSFNLQELYKMVILNWQWFILSLVVCVSAAFLYLRYSTPVYQTTAKLLIKEDDNRRASKNMLANMTQLGFMSASEGIDNEMEILKSSIISEDAVRDLKLHTAYYHKGRLRKGLLYQTQPVNVDLDLASLDTLKQPVKLVISKDKGAYTLEYKYTPSPALHNGEYVDLETKNYSHQIKSIPSKVKTPFGYLMITKNDKGVMKDGETMLIEIVPPALVAKKYMKNVSVELSSKNTSIAVLTLNDISIDRGLDYLQALVDAYNRQANNDKNEIAMRTEEFVNGRLEKISEELGKTDGSVEKFKRDNKVIELQLSAAATMTNSTEYDQKLTEVNMQISLLNSLATYIDDDKHKYQVIPSNIGLTDVSTTSLIAEYNKLALERSTLLRTASDLNPALRPITQQLDDLHSSIKMAMRQAKKALDIQRNSMQSVYNKSQHEILSSPEQQRVMAEIGRQQEVQTALYTMLLQKREENSISLAATADKGKLIDKPQFVDKVRPKGKIIMLFGLIMGLGLPIGILMLLQYFKYKVENEEDLKKLCELPMVASIPVATEEAKTLGEIVVHENENNTLEEIFRSLRTNIGFMMEEEQKVILFTSSKSGEGKTFVAGNLAMSFALLGKKVALIGLDIRRPRLGQLFSLKNRNIGITNLLMMNDPTMSDVKSQIVSSGVNANLDILMAGPVPPNPAELIQRKQLTTVLEHLKKEYDYIIIDTAPVGIVSDTLNICKTADVSVIVTRADYTTKSEVGLISELATEGKMKNVAIVLNGIDMSKRKNSYRYGYGKYGKYGSYMSTRTAGSYGSYGNYGRYSNSHYSNKGDKSVKL